MQAPSFVSPPEPVAYSKLDINQVSTDTSSCATGFPQHNQYAIKRKDFETKCINDQLKLNTLIKQTLSTYHLRQCMNISLENSHVDIYRVNIK